MFRSAGQTGSAKNSAYLEVQREEVTDAYRDLVQIRGGMDRLPDAFLPKVGSRVRLGARVVALNQTPSQATIHYRTRAGKFDVSGDFAVITMPFPALRHIEVLPAFSRAKQ